MAQNKNNKANKQQFIITALERFKGYDNKAEIKEDETRLGINIIKGEDYKRDGEKKGEIYLDEVAAEKYGIK